MLDVGPGDRVCLLSGSGGAAGWPQGENPHLGYPGHHSPRPYHLSNIITFCDRFQFVWSQSNKFP